MSDLTYGNYQDDSIPTVETTRAQFTVAGNEMTAYNYNGVVCLNLSQAAKLVGKEANSLFDFLASNTLKMTLEQHQTNSATSYYTSDVSQKGGKPARIVPIGYVTLYWSVQAFKAENHSALRLMYIVNSEKVQGDAKTALGMGEAKAISQEDQLIQMAEASIKFAKLMKAAKNNPGDARQMDMTLSDVGCQLDGYSTIFDMAESNGIELTPVQARSVGMIMAGIVKGRKEQKAMPKVRRRVKAENGHWQSYLVNTYPVSMTSSFLSAYQATVDLT